MNIEDQQDPQQQQHQPPAGLYVPQQQQQQRPISFLVPPLSIPSNISSSAGNSRNSSSNNDQSISKVTTTNAATNTYRESDQKENQRPESFLNIRHKNNKTNELSPQQQSILRYGETMESFFQWNHPSFSTTTEYKNLCTMIIQGDKNSTTDDPVSLLSIIEQKSNSWRRLLDIRCSQSNDRSNNDNNNDLLRLHRRATTYFTSIMTALRQERQQMTTTTASTMIPEMTLSHLCRCDLLRIWLSYATVQAQNDPESARMTIRHIQNQSYLIDGRIGTTKQQQQQQQYYRDAIFYISWSKIEEEGSDLYATAESILRDGIQKKAEPILDLHNALRALQQKKKQYHQQERCNIVSSTSTGNSKKRLLDDGSVAFSPSPHVSPSRADLLLQSDNAPSQNSNMSLDTDTGNEILSTTITASSTDSDSKITKTTSNNPSSSSDASGSGKFQSNVQSNNSPLHSRSGALNGNASFVIPTLQSRHQKFKSTESAVAPKNQYEQHATIKSTSLLEEKQSWESNTKETKQQSSRRLEHKDAASSTGSSSDAALETIISATKVGVNSIQDGRSNHRLLSTSTYAKPNHNTGSIGRSRASFKRPPLQFKTFGLGKAERVDPSQSMILSDSDDENHYPNKNEKNKSSNVEEKETPVDVHKTPVTKKPKLSKMDLDYMWNWDPEKRLNTSTSSPATAVDSTPQNNSAPERKEKQPPQQKQTNPHGTPSVSMSSSSSNSTATNSSNKSSTTPIPPTSNNHITKASKDDPIRDVVSQVDDKSSSTSREIVETQRKSMSKSDDTINLNQINSDFLPLIQETNMIRVNQQPYIKLGVIGKGGSCKVYRALSKDCSVLAIKKVKTDDLDKKAIDGYANEIALLKRLRGNPAIIQLHDSEVDMTRQVILLVMEAGEADLNHVLQRQTIGQQRSHNNELRSLNMNFIRLTWQQMLKAVHSIHEQRIIHGDLKPANFLFVRGSLKLIDFGIAKAIQNDNTTNIYRENQIGTLNYMSPEAICDSGTSSLGQRMKCGRPSDIWSLGCILYQMVYGKTPLPIFI